MPRSAYRLEIVLGLVAAFGICAAAPAQAQRLNPALADDFLRLLSEMRPAIAASGDDTARAVARALDDPAIAADFRRIVAAAATVPPGAAAAVRARLRGVAADPQYVTSARGREVLLGAADSLGDTIVASPRLTAVSVLLRIRQMEPDAAIDYRAEIATLNDSWISSRRTKIYVGAALSAAGLAGTAAACQTLECFGRRYK